MVNAKNAAIKTAAAATSFITPALGFCCGEIISTKTSRAVLSNSTINTTKVFEKTGNRYTYSVNSMKTNTDIPDATFVFDAKKFPGVETCKG